MNRDLQLAIALCAFAGMGLVASEDPLSRSWRDREDPWKRSGGHRDGFTSGSADTTAARRAKKKAERQARRRAK